MDRPKPSTIATPVGRDAAPGSASSPRLPQPDPSLRSWRSTAQTSKPPLGIRRKRGELTQAVGVSRGGRTTKIHCLADRRGRIPAVALTPGNMADITMAVPLLEALAPTRRLIADKAYDADRLRAWLQEKGIEAVIPGRAARAVAYPLNRAAYRRRNVIERMLATSRTGNGSQRDMTSWL